MRFAMPIFYRASGSLSTAFWVKPEQRTAANQAITSARPSFTNRPRIVRGTASGASSSSFHDCFPQRSFAASVRAEPVLTRPACLKLPISGRGLDGMATFLARLQLPKILEHLVDYRIHLRLGAIPLRRRKPALS